MTGFRRAFLDTKHEPNRLGVELGDSTVLMLPNPTPEGAVYDARIMLRRVVAVGSINRERWEVFTEEGK